MTPERKEGSPENFNEILSRLFAARGWGRVSERSRLEEGWKAVAGSDIEPHTRVGSLRRGILEIDVRNTVLVQELTQFHKRRLLAALRKKLTSVEITDLKFRVASW